MDKKEYKWHIKHIQSSYQSLNLTFEQAEKVYQFEQVDKIQSDDYFSFWEEMDFEKDTFQHILTPEQVSIYEQSWQERVQYHVIQLSESDERELDMLAFHEQILDYQREKLTPIINESRLKPFLSIEPDIINKAEYLRKEYKRYWQEEKKRIYIEHYRHYRHYRPNTLKSELLSHEISSIFPDFHNFQLKMDEPTKTMLSYIEKNIKENIRQYKRFYEIELEQPIKAYHTFFFDTFEHVQAKWGSSGGYMNVSENEVTDENLIALFMSILLMDDEPIQKGKINTKS